MTAASAPRRLLVLGGGSEIAEAFINACSSSLETVVLAGRLGGTTDAAAVRLAERHPQLDLSTAAFDASETVGHQQTLLAVDNASGPFDTVLLAFGQLGEPFTLDADPHVAAQLAHVNFSGAVSASLASLNLLRGEPNARLIVISSIAAVRPRIGNLVYGAAKSGLDHFVNEVRAPAAKLGVSVMLVRPGFVHTRMTDGLEPAPFATTADAVAADIVTGIEKGRAVVHSPNVLAPVGLALKNLPGPIWRRVSAR